MESALLGLVLDSSVLIAAERRNLTAVQAIEGIQKVIAEVPVVLSAVTVAEIGYGIYRANTPEIRRRRRAFLDDLKASITINPLRESTGEIIARIGGEQAALGVNLPLRRSYDCSLRDRTRVCHRDQRPRLQPHPRPAIDLSLVAFPGLKQIPSESVGTALRVSARCGFVLTLLSDVPVPFCPRGIDSW